MKDHLVIGAGVTEGLYNWGTGTSRCQKFPDLKIAPGLYVFANGKTWQPWRVYNDFNVTSMRTFKPSPGLLGRYIHQAILHWQNDIN
jgi:hypothetical protein